MTRLFGVILVALLLATASLVYAADLTVQKPALTGSAVTYAAAAAGGDTFTNTGQEVLHVRTAGSPVVVTVTAQSACNQGVVHNQQVTVPATSERAIGPFRDLKRWNTAQSKVAVTYDQVTGVTVAVVGR